MLEKRLAAWAQFEAMPWPKSDDEAWRRTRLTGFKLDNFQPYAQADGKPATVDALVQVELDEMQSAAWSSRAAMSLSGITPKT